MAKPANYPLNVRIGDTETVSVTIQDFDGDPINITGRTYSAQIREKAGADTPIATFSCSVIDGAQGKFSCVLSSAITSDLEPANAVWDLQESYGSVITTLLAGTATISRDVTR